MKQLSLDRKQGNLTRETGTSVNKRERPWDLFAACPLILEQARESPRTVSVRYNLCLPYGNICKVRDGDRRVGREIRIQRTSPIVLLVLRSDFMLKLRSLHGQGMATILRRERRFRGFNPPSITFLWPKNGMQDVLVWGRRMCETAEHKKGENYPRRLCWPYEKNRQSGRSRNDV